MTTPPPILLFHPPGAALPGKCEVLGCDRDIRRTYPTDRKICVYHLMRVIGRGFWGCGCGPDPCPACARHLAAGKRILLVGERENRAGWETRDEQQLTDVEFHKKQGGIQQVLRFLERAGALRWGSSRKRLLSMGLRWDNALNLLGPSGRIGSWSAPTAKQVVREVAQVVPENYDFVVLLGSKVAEAWKFAEAKPQAIYLPHPSGRNRAWNDPAKVAECKAMIDAIYASPTDR